MNPLNLDAYSLSLLAAKEDIVSGRSSTDWAIFTYEKRWSLKLQDSGDFGGSSLGWPTNISVVIYPGYLFTLCRPILSLCYLGVGLAICWSLQVTAAGGLEEFIKKLSSGSVLYGLCRVTDPNTKTPRTVLIYWVGDHVDESQREISRSHLPAMQKFFKEADALVSAQRVEDLSLEAVVEALTRSAPPVRTFHRPRVSGSHEGVGTNYRKTNPAAEMRFSNRESFWERSEREEERRKEEERARIVEERIALEKERIQRERAEEEERERRIREKERLVEEQRKEQVRLEAERSRMEKTRWVQQQKEYEEEMRGRFKRSQSIEMAAEAALLVSHRTMHPRDFFRQQERSVSCSSPPSTPNSPSRSPQSFFPRQTFRYQRSLTESILPQSPRSPHCSPSTQNWNPMMSPPGPQPLSPAFIFSKSALPATSPRADSLPSFIPPPIALNRAVPFQNKTSPPTHVQKVTSPKLLPQDASGGAEPDVEHPQKPLEAQPPHNSSGDLSLQARPLPPSTTQAYTTVETTLQSAPLTAETTLQSAPLTLETTLQSAPLTAETTLQSAPLTVKTTLQTTPPSTDIIPQIASSTVQTTPLTATPTSEIILQTAPSSVETTLQTSSAMEEMPLQITPPTSVTILQTAPSIAENTVQSAPPPAETTLNSAEAPAEDALRPIQTTLPPAPSAPYTANSIPIADPLDTQYTSSVTTPLESPLNAQATPSERAPTHQGQPSDVSLTGNPLAFEGHPIANLAGLEAPPTESSLTFEVLPTDNLVAFEAPPSESLTSKASPTNTLVAFEAPPAESPLTCDVTPTGNLIEFEAPPTENTLTHEAPPTDNLVALEVPPTESSLICDATPTDNLIEFKALPSEISLTHEAPPTDRFVAFEGPPTESTLMCEAPPIDNFSAFEAPPTESSLMREDPPTDNLAAFEAPLIESSLKCKAPPINDLVTFEAPPTERSLVSQTPKPETSDCESQVLQPQTPGGEPEHSATGGALYAPGHQSPVSTDIKEHPSDGLF